MISDVEFWKLVVSVLTPVSVVIIGFLLNSRLKRIDESQWQDRRVIDKRLELFEKIAPDLNLTYVFCMWVGYWKDISPDATIAAKRRLDKEVNIYRFLLSEDFYSAYNAYIYCIFRTHTGAGRNAKIRCEIEGRHGNRRTDCNYDWRPEFDGYFEETDPAKPGDVHARYQTMMNALRQSLGLDQADLNMPESG